MMLTPQEIRAIAHELADELAARKRHDHSLCSFCRKHRKDVRLLVAGVDATICDECIEVSAKVVAEELARR